MPTSSSSSVVSGAAKNAVIFSLVEQVMGKKPSEAKQRIEVTHGAIQLYDKHVKALGHAACMEAVKGYIGTQIGILSSGSNGNKQTLNFKVIPAVGYHQLPKEQWDAMSKEERKKYRRKEKRKEYRKKKMAKMSPEDIAAMREKRKMKKIFAYDSIVKQYMDEKRVFMNPSGYKDAKKDAKLTMRQNKHNWSHAGKWDFWMQYIQMLKDARKENLTIKRHPKLDNEMWDQMDGQARMKYIVDNTTIDSQSIDVPGLFDVKLATNGKKK